MNLKAIVRVALGAGLLGAAAGCDSTFVASGSMVQGTECLLFESDSGKQYVLSDVAGLVPSDQVTVFGRLDPNCATVCSTGNGCIEDAVIVNQGQEIDTCGTLIAGAECTLFEAAGGLGTFVVDKLDGFTVGDTVSIVGWIRPNCVSTCQQGDGCVSVRRIEACLE